MSKIKRTTITLPNGLYKRAKADMARQDYTSFSDYVQSLIRATAPLLEQETDPATLREQPVRYGKPTPTLLARWTGMKIFPVLLSIGLFAGCSTPSRVWYQPDKTPAQANQDYTECLDHAISAHVPYSNISFVGRLEDNGRRKDYIHAAMAGRGYQLVPESSITNAALHPHE